MKITNRPSTTDNLTGERAGESTSSEGENSATSTKNPGILQDKYCSTGSIDNVKMETTAGKKQNKIKEVWRIKSDRLDTETIKLTFVMVLVALTFVLSFLPHLSLMVFSAIERDYRGDFRGGCVAYHLGRRSFLLNSSVNPWIYGIFNSGSRHFFFARLCNRCQQNG